MNKTAPKVGFFKGLRLVAAGIKTHNQPLVNTASYLIFSLILDLLAVNSWFDSLNPHFVGNHMIPQPYLMYLNTGLMLLILLITWAWFLYSVNESVNLNRQQGVKKIGSISIE